MQGPISSLNVPNSEASFNDSDNPNLISKKSMNSTYFFSVRTFILGKRRFVSFGVHLKGWDEVHRFRFDLNL